MCENCKTYVPYHLHSSLSNPTSGQKADCVTNYDLYLDKAKEYGIKTFGFAEHGNILNHIKKKEAIEENGMKYIHGVEAYLTEKIEYDKDTGKPVNLVRDNYHWIMIAKNYEGYKELNQLISNSFSKEDGHFYYNPRITFEEMMSTSDNIIHTTACLASPLWKLSKKINSSENTDEIKHAEKTIDMLTNWIKDNNDRVFLEVQYHDDNEQIEFNRMLLRISNRTGAKLIAGTDTHALNQDYADTRKVFLESKGASYGNEDKYDLTFKSYDEVVELFDKQGALLKSTYMEAIHNTNVLGDMIETFEHNSAPKYPKLYDNSEEVFKQKINEGFIKRGLNKKENKQEYLDAIKEEFKVYKSTGSIDYMLLQKYIIDWCHDNGIYQGYGRGSVNGSIIAYILGITEMDSIKHNLNFFRFLNPERVSLPDIDVDFPPSRRQDVIDFLATIEGIDFSEIVTINLSKLKNSIRDIGRGLGMPLNEVDTIAKEVETFGGKDRISEKTRKKYPELFHYVDLLMNTVVSVGSHPSGFLVSPVSIDQHVGTMTTKNSKYKVSQLNMKELDAKNYVKLDILGLMNMELINKTCDLAGIERLTPDNVDVDDMQVWKSLAKSTLGVFQFEGRAGTMYIEKLFKPDVLERINANAPEVSYINLLSMANGAIRPAGDSYRDRLAEGEFNDNGHEALNKMLKTNMGYLLFQEDIMQFLTDFCGFTGAESDTVRRGFAKKTGTQQYLPKIHDGFIKSMTETYGENEEEYERILTSFIKVIEDSSNYGFSLNHSQPYSYIGYVGAYLRYHYPLEFLTTALELQKDDKEQTSEIITYAKSEGIKIKNIEFGKSQSEYNFDKDTNTIYKGINSIKYMNDQIAGELYSISKQKDYSKLHYTDLLIDVIERTSTDSRQMSILINLNFFKQFGQKEVLSELWDCMRARDKRKPMPIKEFEDTKKFPVLYNKTYTDNTKQKRIGNIKLYAQRLEENPLPKKTLAEQISFEKDSLGYAITTYPELSNAYALVLEMNLKYTPVITLYKLNSGEEIKVKISKKKFYDINDDPLIQTGNIIKITGTHEEYAKRLVDGKWEENKSVTWLFVDRLTIVS